MKLFEAFLLLCLIVCALATSFTEDLLIFIIIFMPHSLSMAIIWVLLQLLDLAITEAAIGVGVTSVLLFVTLKKVRAIQKKDDDKQTEK